MKIGRLQEGTVHMFVDMIDSLVFHDWVTDGIQHLLNDIPDRAGLDDLLNYFDIAYIASMYSCR